MLLVMKVILPLHPVISSLQINTDNNDEDDDDDLIPIYLGIHIAYFQNKDTFQRQNLAARKFFFSLTSLLE